MLRSELFTLFWGVISIAVYNSCRWVHNRSKRYSWWPSVRSLWIAPMFCESTTFLFPSNVKGSNHRYTRTLLDWYKKKKHCTEPAWLGRLERTLCCALDPRFKAYKCLYIHVCGLKKAWLPVNRSAVVVPEVNLKNPLYTGAEACKWGIHPGFKTRGRCHQKSKTGTSVVP